MNRHRVYGGATSQWHGLFSGDGEFLVVRRAPPIGVASSWVHVVVHAPTAWGERRVRTMLRSAWLEGSDDTRALRNLGGTLSAVALVIGGQARGDA